MPGDWNPLQLSPELTSTLLRLSVALDELESVHEPTVTSSAASSAPGQAATPTVVGTSILGLAFTLNTDNALRTFKFPATYIDHTASFHIHWTKSTNTNDSGKNVRWRVTYNVFDGKTQNVVGGSHVLEVEATYLDAGLTDRYIYRTNNVSFDGLVQPNYYVGLKVEAVTPTGVALSEPVLISLDLMYQKRVHSL